SGEPCAANVNLARRFKRNELRMAVRNVNLQVGNWPADEASSRLNRIGGSQRPVGHVDCCLGDAIHIDQARLVFGMSIEPGSEALEIQCFTPQNYIPYPNPPAPPQPFFRPH